MKTLSTQRLLRGMLPGRHADADGRLAGTGTGHQLHSGQHLRDRRRQ
jgi:hypothetical protein